MTGPDALAHRHDRIRLAGWGVKFAFILVIAAMNPFGLVSASDRESESVLLHLLAPLYQGTGFDDLAVLLVTDNDLEQWNLDERAWAASDGDGAPLLDPVTWPIEYSTYLSLIDHLDQNDVHEIFLDLYFKYRHSDYTAFVDHIEQREHATFTVGMPGEPQDGASDRTYGVIQEVAEVAPVTFARWARNPGRYPLWIRSEEGDWRPSPALALYEARCARGLKGCDASLLKPPAPDDDTPWIAPIWSALHPDALSSLVHSVRRQHGADPSDVGPACADFQDGVADLFAVAARGLLSFDPLIQPCPPFKTIEARDLLNLHGAGEAGRRLEKGLDGTQVLVGTAIDGINDKTTSPVHGDLPGVFIHAAALDNLTTFNGDVLRHPASLLGELSINDLLEVLLLAVMIWKARQIERAARATGAALPAARKRDKRAILALFATLSATTLVPDCGSVLAAAALVGILVAFARQRPLSPAPQEDATEAMTRKQAAGEIAQMIALLVAGLGALVALAFVWAAAAPALLGDIAMAATPALLGGSLFLLMTFEEARRLPLIRSQCAGVVLVFLQCALVAVTSVFVLTSVLRLAPLNWIGVLTLALIAFPLPQVMQGLLGRVLAPVRETTSNGKETT